MIKDEIPIVVAFTPNYIGPVATAILSVIDHASPTDFFHFICLMTEQLPQHLQARLSRLTGAKARFSFLDLEGKLNDIYVDEKYTIAASYRLLLPDLLPAYEKVLYIDCDMIFRNNLADIFRNTHIENYYLAGIAEATLPFQIHHMNSIGCAPGSYINSGFLLMNLKMLRQNNMVQKFLEASKDEDLEFPDQDVINQLCKGKILMLPPYYNSIRTFLLPQYKADFLKFYNLSDWEMIQLKGNIHYTGPKPWNTFTVKFDIWWKYYNLLPPEIKGLFNISKKTFLLAIIYKNSYGKFLIDATQKIFRSVKNKLS